MAQEVARHIWHPERAVSTVVRGTQGSRAGRPQEVGGSVPPHPAAGPNRKPPAASLLKLPTAARGSPHMSRGQWTPPAWPGTGSGSQAGPRQDRQLGTRSDRPGPGRGVGQVHLYPRCSARAHAHTHTEHCVHTQAQTKPQGGQRAPGPRTPRPETHKHPGPPAPHGLFLPHQKPRSLESQKRLGSQGFRGETDPGVHASTAW